MLIFRTFIVSSLIFSWLSLSTEAHSSSSKTTYPQILATVQLSQDRYRIVVKKSESSLDLWDVDIHGNPTLLSSVGSKKGAVPHFEDLSSDGNKVLFSYVDGEKPTEIRYEVGDVPSMNFEEIEITIPHAPDRVPYAKFSPKSDLLFFWSADLPSRSILQGRKTSFSKTISGLPQVCQIKDEVACHNIDLLAADREQFPDLVPVINRDAAREFSIGAMSMDSNQSRLLMGTDAGRLLVFDPTSGNRLMTLAQSSTTGKKAKHPIKAVTQFSPDGSLIVEADSLTFPQLSTSTIRLWQTNQPESVEPFLTLPVPSKQDISQQGIAFSRDSKTVAMRVGSEIWMIDTTSGNKQVLHSGKKSNVKANPSQLLFNHDGNMLLAVTGGEKAKIEFFDRTKTDGAPFVVPLPFLSSSKGR